MIKYGINKSNLTLAGHSLGGILTAQIVSYLHLKGYAYDPFGANLLSYKRYKKYSNIINNWADKNIYTISYQDEGLINGDILSNLIGFHLGKFIPILGKNVGLDGHGIDVLNNAIKEHKDIIW